MDWKKLAVGLTAASAATLVYGSLVEANRLVIERKRLRLPRWPAQLDGFKIAFLADFHLRDRYSVDLGKRAVEAALREEPDFLCLGGDYVGYWKLESAEMLGEVLEPVSIMNGNVVAVPGNHDYWSGDASLLEPIFEWLNIKLLRNGVWRHEGITWIGIDSANMGHDDAYSPFVDLGKKDDPIIVLWHEPDPVDRLPQGASLMLSGHSHGGQFTFPWGWTPMHTKNGEKYVAGWYPDAPTPLYVSRGIGTTGPPSRLCCPPEVSILTLESP